MVFGPMTADSIKPLLWSPALFLGPEFAELIEKLIVAELREILLFINLRRYFQKRGGRNIRISSRLLGKS